MYQICRLCLTVSENMVCKLGEGTKILDILSCLNIQIIISKTLPSLICKCCSKVLDDFINYRENVLQNQLKLIETIKNTPLDDDFHKNLVNKSLIKTELDVYDKEETYQAVYEFDPINNPRINKTEREDEVPSYYVNNDDTISQHSVNLHPKRNEIVQDEKKAIKLNKEKCRPQTNKIQLRIRKNKQGQCQSGTEDKCAKTRENSKANMYGIEKTLKAISYAATETSVDNLTSVVNETRFKINDSKCLTCFECLPSNSELIKHYKTNHCYVDKENNGTVFVNDNTSAENIQVNNKNTDTTSEKPYNCRICGRTYTSVYSIIRHARAHSVYTLSCSRGCGYSTVYRGALADHEKRHNKDFRYKCSTCGVGFHVKTWYDQHQNIHKNVKPFVCNVCGMAFHMSRYLTSHRTTVHADIIKGNKIFVCPHCGLHFDTTRHFRKHLEVHRGKKKYLCALCGKECSSNEQLKYHNNSHLGLKPFACSICNKRFAKKFNLTVHQRAHAGEKHLCQECGKHFAQRSTLLRHNRKCHPEIKQNKTESESEVNK